MRTTDETNDPIFDAVYTAIEEGGYQAWAVLADAHVDDTERPAAHAPDGVLIVTFEPGHGAPGTPTRTGVMQALQKAGLVVPGVGLVRHDQRTLTITASAKALALVGMLGRRIARATRALELAWQEAAAVYGAPVLWLQAAVPSGAVKLSEYDALQIEAAAAELRQLQAVKARLEAAQAEAA